MKLVGNVQRIGSEGLAGGALRLAALAFVFGAGAGAQSMPASLSTVPQPYSDRPVFDASGNTYFLYGPATIGAAQPNRAAGRVRARRTQEYPFQCLVPTRP